MKFKYLILILPVFLIASFFYLFPLKYHEEVQAASDKFKVDKKLIFAIIKIESNFEKDAISKKGAVGLMQVMPSTANWIIEKNDMLPDEYDLFNPADNIEVGVMYLKYLLDKYDGDEQKTLIAYNAGPARLKDGSWRDIEETQNYLKKYKIVNKAYDIIFRIRRI